MRHRLQLIAAAFLAMIVVGLLWKAGPLSSSQSFAFEQVQDALRQVRSVSYTVTTTGWKNQPWPDPHIVKCMALEPGQMRTETEGEVQITNAQLGRFIRIQHKDRRVAIRPLYPTKDGTSSPFDDFSQRLRNIPAAATQHGNEHEVDGRHVVTFIWHIEDADHVVDVDAVTKLPIRMDVSRGKIGDKEIREVFSDFVFDAPLDEALFSVKPPEGYAVEERVPDPSNDSYPEKDAATLIVSPGNFGPVKSDMKAEEIIQLLGKPDWISKAEIAALPVPKPSVVNKTGTVETLEYDSRGFQLTILPSGGLTISCFNQARSGPLVRDFVGQTKEGVKLGASREEILSKYGKPEMDQTGFLGYLELGWQFMFRENKLCGINTTPPMPRRQANGIRTRVLKNGTVLQAAPGVDIDTMIDEDGNITKKKLWKKEQN